MTQPFFDILGCRVDIGEIVAVAFPDGSSADLRIGKVISFIEKPQPDRFNRNTQTYHQMPPELKIEIEWDQARTGGWVPDKPTKIRPDKSRFIKVPAYPVI